MVCEVKTVNSNVTSLSIAEEECIGKLPTTPDWYKQSPLSYSDYGLTTTVKERSTINEGRMDQKGSVTSFEAKFGYSTNLTKSTIQRLMQGFLYANAREKTSTNPFNGSKIALTAVSTSQYQAGSGLNAFKTNDLVYGSGFENSENNGLARVTTVATGALTVDKTLVAEVPSATAYVENCGYQFGSGDISIAVSANSIKLVSAADDFTTLGLNVGETIGIGGDDTATYFANNTQGYARILKITASELFFDDTTFTAVADSGTGKTIQIFFGKFIKNEATRSLIKKRYYQSELQLGNDSNGIQSQYLTGCTANELKINMPTEDEITCDLSFMSIFSEERSGTQGLKSGNRYETEEKGEAPINTSSNLYRSRISLLSDSVINNDDLFGYVLSSELTINNGVTLVKALSNAAAIDTNEGNFTVSGSMEAYFTKVSAFAASKELLDVAINYIMAIDNNGIVFDIPKATISTEGINIEKDSSLRLPVNFAATRNNNDYVFSVTFLPYLPDALMPTI